MKKILMLVLLSLCYWQASAQKTALVDMEYVLGKIPAYEMMNRQLEDLSKKWQEEVNREEQEAQGLYKKYQSELVFLSPEQKKAKEEAIVGKEKAAYELKRKYFGPDGELFKRREALMKPIQDEVWKSLKELALRSGYQIIIDKSSSKIVYADPSADISASVLQKLGFEK